MGQDGLRKITGLGQTQAHRKIRSEYFILEGNEGHKGICHDELADQFGG